MVSCLQLFIYILSALCSSLSSPSNGTVASTGNSVGDTATYTCNTGFELIGQTVVTCTQATDGNSASFSPAEPICLRKFHHYKWYLAIKVTYPLFSALCKC